MSGKQQFNMYYENVILSGIINIIYYILFEKTKIKGLTNEK